MRPIKPKRIVIWHEGHIKNEDRERLLRQKGAVVWFTGLSGSGKSTIAHRVEEKLFEMGHTSYVLDGDNVRHGLNKDLGFSPEDREENIRRLGEVAHLFADAGLIILTAFISPYRRDRRRARNLMLKGRFIEVFCQCNLPTCEQRDPKGMYKKARAGEIAEFTGISAPYEQPENAEIVLHTDRDSVDVCAENVLLYLMNNGIISKTEQDTVSEQTEDKLKKRLEDLG
jgi:adenylylsulfate kinase